MPDPLSSDFSEPGFLKRLRNWRDAMPWLAMGDCLGPATSIVAMCLSIAAILLGSFGVFSAEWLLRDDAREVIPIAAQYPPSLGRDSVDFISDGVLRKRIGMPVFLRTHEYLTSPLRSLSTQDSSKACLVRLLQQFFLLIIWIVPAGYVMRQTVLALAGRERMATLDTIKLVGSRSLSFLSGPSLTLGFALFLALYFVFVGYLNEIPYVGQTLATIGSILGIPIALGIGILGFGILITFPLMWASIVSESYSDGFDSASRGFEYLIQRPFRFAAYVLIAVVLSSIAMFFLVAIVSVGTLIVERSFQMGASRNIPSAAQTLLHSIPLAFAFNLFWAFSAGIYLLLRRDSNHQEIEDVWEPEQPQPKPLPDLGSEGTEPNS